MIVKGSFEEGAESLVFYGCSRSVVSGERVSWNALSTDKVVMVVWASSTASLQINMEPNLRLYK